MRLFIKRFWPAFVVIPVDIAIAYSNHEIFFTVIYGATNMLYGAWLMARGLTMKEENNEPLV